VPPIQPLKDLISAGQDVDPEAVPHAWSSRTTSDTAVLLHTSGINAFRGYYKNPAETAATILDGGWVRTGDQGSLDRRGQLLFLGRLKDVLKVGGENVSPLEVEALLSTHQAVHMAQVVGRPSERYGEEPVAFCATC
jgi:acyl-CoA synthetase (AMP-forming)/AMP-acid ligase II